jgi:hypothetical protein
VKQGSSARQVRHGEELLPLFSSCSNLSVEQGLSRVVAVDVRCDFEKMNRSQGGEGGFVQRRWELLIGLDVISVGLRLSFWN